MEDNDSTLNNPSTEYAPERPRVLDLKPDSDAAPPNSHPSRREFLTGAAGVGATLAIAPLLLEGEAGAATTPYVPAHAAVPTVPPVEVTLTINGAEQILSLEPRVTLLDALRERLHITGTKKGCDHGQCGACTVHIDGRRVNSCLTLAIMHQGQKITTIEGLANGDTLHPMQSAFILHDAFQCGYCTPGQIMSAAAILQEGHIHGEADIREQMSGNICRCGAYPNIVAAVMHVMNGYDGKLTSAQERSGEPSGEPVVLNGQTVAQPTDREGRE